MLRVKFIDKKWCPDNEENLIESVEEAKTQYDQIVAEESKDLTELRNKISDALKEVPTFESMRIIGRL